MQEKLIKLLENSYSPYYHFPVASIVVTKDGKEFKGVNVENANGTSICAERNAIASMVASGYKPGDIDKLYLMLSSGKIGTPCFACRQVLQEFMDLDAKVICIAKDGSEQEYSIKELCPYPFNSSDLENI